VGSENVEHPEERRRQADRLQRFGHVCVRGPPEPEEELTGELGDLGISGSAAFHSLILARLLRRVNNL